MTAFSVYSPSAPFVPFVQYSRVLRSMATVILLMLGLLGTPMLSAQEQPPATPPAHWGAISINMESIEYPHPVNFLHRNLYGQDVRIAYMDVAPTAPANGRTVVLLHGSSYYALYWKDTITALTAAGFRVVTVDRLGWGKSAKPLIPYSAHLHASNTKAILDHLGISEVAIVGHSMGGRMASTFAYTYPETTTHLGMVNPIGLDNSTQGRVWRDPDSGPAEPDLQQVYESNLRTETRRIVNWKAKHLDHVRIRYGMALSGEYHRLNMVRALNRDLLAEPVDSFWPKIQAPAIMIAGAQDGPNFPERARRATDLLPNGTLYLIEEAGHNPHEETPEEFNAELIRFLNSQ